MQPHQVRRTGRAGGKALPKQPLFETGRFLVSAHALSEVDPDDAYKALARHQTGDWGDVDFDTAQSNAIALKEGNRLLSHYRDRNGVEFCIRTYSDRSITTLLLPREV
jgi:hypothetical protein